MLLAFTLIAGALIAFALATLLRPLESGGRSWRVLGVVLVFAGLVASLYQIVGNPKAFDTRLTQPAATMDDAIAQLQARIEAAPADSKALILLAQAYTASGKPELVLPTLQRALKADPSNADVRVEAADTLLLIQTDRKIPDIAMSWLEEAVSINPRHERARWFLGIAQRQRGDNKAAATTWEPLLPLVDRSAGEALLLEVNAARQDAGLSPLGIDRLKAIPPEAIRVQITLPDALRAQLTDTAVVFISAKPEGARGMPVAAKRYAIAELPGSVFLSDQDSPMPTAKLSALKRVVIEAKISPSGSATASSGDIRVAPQSAIPGQAAPIQIQFSAPNE